MCQTGMIDRFKLKRVSTMAKAKTFTVAEVEAMLAKARIEGAESARKAKSDNREARKTALSREGWTLFPQTPERAAANILGEGVYVIPGEKGVVIEGSVVMSRQGEVFMPRYRLSVRPVWGATGDTDTDAVRLVRNVALKAKHAAEIVSQLDAAYDDNATGHTYRDRKAAKANA
jgi:hypothetical protein